MSPVIIEEFEKVGVVCSVTVHLCNIIVRASQTNLGCENRVRVKAIFRA